MSSQWGSQKLIQGLASHELAAYLSCFNLFLTQWTIAILSKGCKPDNFESHNSLTLTNICGLLLEPCWMWIFPWIKLSWHCGLILAISLWRVIFLYSERIMLLICMILQFMWRKDGTGLISGKLYGFLLLLSIGFTSLSVLFLFPLSITFFVFMHSFWFFLV